MKRLPALLLVLVGLLATPATSRAQILVAKDGPLSMATIT